MKIDIIDKENFVKIIKELQRIYSLEEKMNSIAKELDQDFPPSIMVTSYQMISDLLKIAIDDKWDIVSWYLYENDFGNKIKKDSITDLEGNNIDVTTPEKLYDYIIECHKEDLNETT